MFDYARMRDGLCEVAERLDSAVREETVRHLDALRAKLREEAFNLVVLGQFKRGKSTFINALLGANILPTAIVPLTSVVTILRFGPELKVEVRFLNESQVDIDLSELPAFITERENPENRKGVKEVTVYYPSEYLRGGVRIIDTPGAGSVYAHNTDVAYNFLPQVDAGVFIISADPPLSGSEHRFLQDVRGYVDKLFFVLNKIDQVSEDERKEALDFTVRILEDDIGEGKVKIYPVSARWALEGKKTGDGGLLERSLLPYFEKQLQEFLIHEKGRVLLQSAVNTLMKLMSDETISFQLEQEAIKLPLQQLTGKINQFETEMRTIEKDRENNRYLLKGGLARIVSGLDERIAEFRKEQVPALQARMEKEYERLANGRTGGLRDNLEKAVFEDIRATFNGWRRQLTENLSLQLEAAHREFASRVNELIERILTLTSSIFELKLKPFTSVEGLSRKSDFYFLLKDDPVGLELIQIAVTSALPGFVAKKLIFKNMRTAVAELVDRHCGRVRYDLVNRMTQAVKDFENALNSKLDSTLEGIRISFQKALALHESGKINADKSLGDLSRKLDSLSGIQDALRSYSMVLNGGETSKGCLPRRESSGGGM